jgi:uncharacterized membrane protein YccC
LASLDAVATMSSEPRSDRFEGIARLFLGAVIGAFVGFMICLRIREVSIRELWPWLVLPASGLLVGLLIAWRGQLVRRSLQRWLWWFP